MDKAMKKSCLYGGTVLALDNHDVEFYQEILSAKQECLECGAMRKPVIKWNNMRGAFKNGEGVEDLIYPYHNAIARKVNDRT